MRRRAPRRAPICSDVSQPYTWPMSIARDAYEGVNDTLKPLPLSRIGHIASNLAVLLVMGLAALVGATGAGFAFFNLFSGRDQDTAVAAQLFFVGFVVVLGSAICLGVCLLGIFAIDLAVRGVRWSTSRRFTNPS